MASVHVVVASANTRAKTGATLPLPSSVPAAADTVTTSAASTQSSAAASAGDIWSVTARNGDVFVKFGANPTAAADDGWLILQGQTREFGATADGEKIALIDAA
jgi:hypothetical protein